MPFQNPEQGWPGLTNGKARIGEGRAIRYAPDPATHRKDLEEKEKADHRGLCPG